jgi:uncharacterized phiE125 gp8 family phage protein
MPLSILTPPAALPVTLASIKQHLRIDQDVEDDLLTELAQGAVDHVEAHIRQVLILRDLRQYVDEVLPNRTIALEAWPIRQINQVTAYDHDGVATTLGDQNYRLDLSNDRAIVRVRPEFKASLMANGLEIDFEAGFGESGLDIPSNIIRSLHLIIAHWYEFRGASSQAADHSLPAGIEKLLNPMRRVRL